MTRRSLIIEGARIGFKNLEGRKEKYNAEGDRNFVVFLDTPFAEELAAEGWNIKFPGEKNEDEIYDKDPYLKIAVNYNNFPPRLEMVDPINQSKVVLDENTVGMVDNTVILSADLEITPYNWKVQGETGVKAYIKSGYFVMESSPFFNKYNWD